jgi:hypothetical protein
MRKHHKRKHQGVSTSPIIAPATIAISGGALHPSELDLFAAALSNTTMTTLTLNKVDLCGDSVSEDSRKPASL